METVHESPWEENLPSGSQAGAQQLAAAGESAWREKVWGMPRAQCESGGVCRLLSHCRAASSVTNWLHFNSPAVGTVYSCNPSCKAGCMHYCRSSGHHPQSETAGPWSPYQVSHKTQLLCITCLYWPLIPARIALCSSKSAALVSRP